LGLDCARSRYGFFADRSLKLFIFNQNYPDRIIGSVNFANFIRGVFQSCLLGYNLAENEQGQGYMTEALRVAIAYVFEELNFHRVMAAYLPHNRRSGNVLKRLGFKVEGYAYDYLMIDRVWQDHVLTSLINPNWQAAKVEF
jgi:ribosomal-protein-alanine N-acetyltransferase